MFIWKKEIKAFSDKIVLLLNIYIYVICKHFLDGNCINVRKSTEGFDYYLIFFWPS